MTFSPMIANRPVPPLPMRERRAFPRHRARGTALCRPAARPFSPGVRGRLLDISQGGVCLLVREVLPAGTRLEIELEPPSGQRGLVRNVEVRWAKTEHGGWRLGCCWDQRLTFAELQRFV